MLHDLAQRPQDRRRQGVEAFGDLGVAAVDREQELEQVVGADRDEIDPLQQFVELIQQRRHFDHGADVDALRQRVAVLAQIGQFALDDRLGRNRIRRLPRSSGT